MEPLRKKSILPTFPQEVHLSADTRTRIPLFAGYVCPNTVSRNAARLHFEQLLNTSAHAV